MQRLIDLARDVRGDSGRRVGKTIAHGSQSGAGRPQSSPLMKFAIRPSPSPIGARSRCGRRTQAAGCCCGGRTR